MNNERLESMLKGYDLRDTTEVRRKALLQIIEKYPIGEVSKTLMIYYRYICWQKKSFDVIDDVRWLDYQSQF